MPIMVGLFPFARRKGFGLDVDGWNASVEGEVRQGEQSLWPDFRTLSRARELEPVLLQVDASAPLPKARSRTFSVFCLAQDTLDAPPDVLLMVDDDIEAPREAVAALVARCRETRGVVSCVYAARLGAKPVAFRHPERNLEVGGAGFLAIHSDAALHLVAWLACEKPPLIYKDVMANGKSSLTCAAAFIEYIDPVSQQWEGEDVAFCLRIQDAGVPFELVKLPGVLHEGRELLTAEPNP